ncbi:hypothetical protein [Ornithinibacillus bavariensis]|uniref:Uncharacterized protein n=1 Tax=Ornithinibacillus bavariensis TaxID=545502 RepID=A0A919XB02_9BACI|nr:hypothetical protein [Ornithinibacillus bavariensis]GIO28304.1 hypothetical protein J43TS3_29150 [Ornithinibacillus bavariensis]
MNHIFNDLKEIMDSTVLKEVNFSEKNKENVRRSLYKTTSKKTIHVKPIFMNIISISLTCLFLIGTNYFLIDKLELSSKEEGLATNMTVDETVSNGASDFHIDKNNPDILPSSEYKNVEEFIISAKYELNSNPPSFENPSKELWQLDVARWITDYAKHFATLSTDKEEIKLLQNIEEASLRVFKAGDPIEPKENQDKLVANLNLAIDEFIKQKIKED